MSDIFPTEKRSRIMRAIHGRDTEPEHIVRRLVHRLGYRFRLHIRALPGCPDIVLAACRKVILVHGCFWHRHSCHKGRSLPSTRPQFWLAKLEANAARDARNRRKLRRMGWSVLTVWECQLTPKRIGRTTERIRAFLGKVR